MLGRSRGSDHFVVQWYRPSLDRKDLALQHMQNEMDLNAGLYIAKFSMHVIHQSGHKHYRLHAYITSAFSI